MNNLDKRTRRLIKDSQSSFTKGKSRLTNSLRFCSKVHAAINNGESYEMIYLYISKIPDKAPHQKFMNNVMLCHTGYLGKNYAGLGHGCPTDNNYN